MKKAKKVFIFVLMAFVAFSGVLFGCGDKYRDLKISTEVEELTLFYGSTESEEEKPTQSFVAKVEGAGSGISTDLTYSLSNGIVSVDYSKQNDNSTLFVVTAKRPSQGGGTTSDLVLMTKEGGKQKTVKINVVYHIADLRANANYDPKKLFVAVGGQVVNQKIDISSFSFDPAETTERDLTFSLLGNVQGVSVQGDTITIDPKQLDASQKTFDIKATSVQKPNLSATITYSIINQFDLKFKLGEDNFVEDSTIFMTTNTKNSERNRQVLTVLPTYLNGNAVDKVQTPFSIEYGTYLDEKCQKLDTRNLLFVDSNESDQIVLQASDSTNSADVYLKVFAKLENFDYATAPKIVHVHIEKIANSISITHDDVTNKQDSSFELSTDEKSGEPKLVSNGQDVTANSTYQIYSTYVGTLGFEFVTNVGDESTAQRQFVLQTEDSQIISVKDKSGNEIAFWDGKAENIDSFVIKNDTNDTTLYISVKNKNLSNVKSVLKIVSVASVKYLTVPIQNVLILETKQGVSKIELQNPTPSQRQDDSTELCKIENLDGTFTLYVPYATNLAQKSQIVLKTTGCTNILTAQTDKDLLVFTSKKAESIKTEKESDDVSQTFVFEVMPKNAGNMQIIFMAENNFAFVVNVKVFTKIDKIVTNLNLSKDPNKQTIGDIKYEDNDKTASVTKISAQKGGYFNLTHSLTFNGTQQNATCSVKYEVGDTNVLAIYGTSIFAREVGSTTLTVTIEYVDDTVDTGLKDYRLEIQVDVYLAIQTVSLRADGSSTSNLQVYVADSLGLNDQEKSTKSIALNVLYSDRNIMTGDETGDYAPVVTWHIATSESKFAITNTSDETYADKLSLTQNGTTYFDISKNGNAFDISAIKMPDDITSFSVTLTVSVSQLNKTIQTKRTIIVQKAKQIQSISDLYFVDGEAREYIQKDYLSNFAGTANISSDKDKPVYYVYKPYRIASGKGGYTYSIEVKTNPSQVANNKVEVVIDYPFGGAGMISNDYSISDSQTNSTHTLTFDALNSGIARFTIYTLDSVYVESDGQNAYKTFVEIYFKVADGTSETTAYEISTASDFALMLSSQSALTSLFYKVKKDIDLSGYVFGERTNKNDKTLQFVNFNGAIDGQQTTNQNGVDVTSVATIYGIKINQHYEYSDSGTTQTANIGVFASANLGSTIKNLNFVLSYVSVDYDSVTDARFGGLVGENNGTIDNVSVTFSSVGDGSNIQIGDNAVQCSVGGLAGKNNGTIDDCHTNGTMLVKNYSTLNSAKAYRYVGGLAGENSNLLVSTSTFFNNANPTSDYSSSMSIDVANTLHGDVAVGGVVGYSTGQVTNQSFDGKINATTNVGGVVGFLNGGTLSGAFCDGLVVGTTNVGGLVGTAQNKAEIAKSSVTFYSPDNYIFGTDNVGGLVGNASNLTISLSYIKSFVDNANGDVRLKQSTENQYLGGLVGNAENLTIEKSYSQASLKIGSAMQYLGGLVGKTSGTNSISNAYEQNTYVLSNSQNFGLLTAQNKGTLSATSFYCAHKNSSSNLVGNEPAFSGTNIITPTNDNYLLADTYSGLGTNDWYSMKTKDDATKLAYYPFLKLDSKTLLTVEEPTSIVVDSAENSKNYVSKVGDLQNTFVLWKYAQNQTRKFVDLFSVVFSINSANISVDDSKLLNVTNDFFLSADNDSVAIVGGTRGAYKLTLNGEGKVNLTITSKANSNLSQTVTIYVKNAIQGFAVKISNSTNNLIVGQTYSLAISSTAGTDYFVSATPNGDAVGKILLNGDAVHSVYDDIAYGAVSNICTSEKFAESSIIFAPYILVENQKIEMPDAKVNLSVSSIYGIESFGIDTQNAQLTPDSQLVVNLVATGTGLGQNSTADNLSIKVQESDEQVDVTNEQLFSTNIQKIDGTDPNTVKYSVTIAINFDKVNDSKYGKTYTLIFEYTQNGQKATQSCLITLQKLELQKISIDFFNNTEKDSNGQYSVKDQVSSSAIVSGKLGLMRINISPKNIEKQIKSIEISHAQTDAYAMSFTQLVKNGEQYLDVGTYTSSIGNGFGISLFAWSNYNDANFSSGFDGNLYVGCIIASTVPQNTAFDITVKVTYNDNLTKSLHIALYSEQPSAVALTYQFDSTNTYGDSVKIDSNSNNFKNAVFVPLGVAKSLLLTTNDLYNPASTKDEVASTVSIYVNDILTNLKVSSQNVTIGETQTTIVIPFIVKSISGGYSIDSGTNTYQYVGGDKSLKIVVECERITNGSRKTYSTQNFTLYPVDFVVKSMSIDQAPNDTLHLTKGKTETLSVTLDCDASKDIQSKIKDLQSAILENCFVQQSTEKENYFYDSTTATLTANKVSQSKFGFAVDLAYDYASGTYRVTNAGVNRDENLMQIQNDNTMSHIIAKMATLEINRSTTDSNATIITSQTQFAQLASVETDEIKEYALAPGLLAGDIDWSNGKTAKSGSVLTLENYIPFDLPQNISFDGNGCTIKIKSFSDRYAGSQFGLFTTIGKNSIVKNFKVVYEQTSPDPLDLSSISGTASFGGICAQNNGTIYACQVYAGSVSDDGKITSSQFKIALSSQANANIGGISGTNNGFVSYSQSRIAISANNGLIGGFAGTNNGKISSCFVEIPAGLTLANTNTSVSANSTLGGFVAKNLTNGTIFGSYVTTDEKASIKSSSQLGGFVSENQGAISNSYVNALLDSGNIGGFVYTNSGSILSSYTQLSLSETAKTSKQTKAFVGIDSTTNAVNNTGTIDDCYYYSGFDYIVDDIATKIDGVKDKSQFAKFAFEEKGSDGIWKWTNGAMPTLVEASREIQYSANYIGFYQKVGEKYYPVQSINATETEYYKYEQKIGDTTNTKPSNVNVECVYTQTTDTEFVDNKVYYVSMQSNGEPVKYRVVKNSEIATSSISSMLELQINVYAIDNTSDNWKNINDDEQVDEMWSSYANAGTDSNPIQIASEDDWNKHFDSKNANNASQFHFVLLNDIEISDTPITAKNNATFNGILHGNNMSITNLYISESATKDVAETTAMGLFAKTDGAKINNLNISMKNNLYANDIASVGILAGIAQKSNFVNISIDANGQVVVGKNFVGGLAGVLSGSTVKNVQVTTSANAVYLIKDRNVTLTTAELRNYKSGDVTNNLSSVDYSYSGVLAGAMIESKETESDATPSNATLVSVSGNCMVTGYYAGLVAGLVGKGSILALAFVTIDPEQSIKSYAVVGGLVGENRGTISRSQIYQDMGSNRNMTLFQGSPLILGGLVGFNNGGTVDSCVSYADVRAVGTSPNLMFAYVAGGLVGLDLAGTIQNSVAVGSVRSDFIVGGLVGAVTSKRYIDSGISKVFNYRTGYDYFEEEEKPTTISNNFASNNWHSNAGGIDDSYYLDDTKLKGMIVGALIDSDVVELTSKFENLVNTDLDSPNYVNLLDTTSKVTAKHDVYDATYEGGTITGTKTEIQNQLEKNKVPFAKVTSVAYKFEMNVTKVGKFVQSFGVKESDIIGKNYLDQSTKYKLEAYSLGGIATNFDCSTKRATKDKDLWKDNSENQILSSENCKKFVTTIINIESDNNIKSDNISYSYKDGEENVNVSLQVEKIHSGAMICTQNNDDYSVVYGKEGVYKNFNKDNENNFVLPYQTESGIYPTLIQNINK